MSDIETPKRKVKWFNLFMLAAVPVALVCVYLYGVKPYMNKKDGQTAAPSVPKKADLPGLQEESSAIGPNGATGTPVAMPGAARCATSGKTQIRHLIWAWNAQMGQLYANGGGVTTQGSLVCQNGVIVTFTRQDDVAQMQAELVAFASALANGNAQPTSGVHYVSIMGDGAASFLAGVNPTLEKLGKDYRAEIVGSAGYSRGEDRFMAPPKVKENPQAARGMLIAGYLRDGDWNIAMKWAGDNEICNNPDEKTWDAECLNWVAADSYIDASQKYIAGYCEDRPKVSRGKRVGGSQRVCVDGVVTWTPGDVMVAKEKGGLVSIVSTKEYSSQMPNVIIGIHAWNQANRPAVEAYLDAVFKGGDAVMASDTAFRKAAEISAAVYKEETAEYWMKYFRGVTETDKQGLQVELGGSKVNNLGDNLVLFGLAPGTRNAFAATYTVFGDIVVQQYPALVPSYPPVGDVLDTSYVQALAARAPVATRQLAEMPTFSEEAPLARTVSRKSWRIEFASGKATFTRGAEEQLTQLLDDLVIAGSVTVEIHGHTDGDGDSDANMALSEARAFAVKDWLEKKAPANFPRGRIRVYAHGETEPIAQNSTNPGKAQNRRVELVLGTTN